MANNTLTALVIAASIALAGCSAQATPTPQASAPSPATVTTAATSAPKPTPTRDPACLDVPTSKVQAILDGSNQGPLAPLKSAAIQSDTGSYFVAIRVKVDGDEQVGVWQTKALDEPSMIGSVNAYAKTYTAWPDTGNAGSKPARDAENCIR